MPTSVITNTILNGVGTPVPDVPVSVRLYPIPGFRIDTGTEVNGLVTTATDANGVWSLALEETANISPAGTYYIVDEAVPGDPHSYAFAVGPNDANLFDSLVTPLPVGPGFSGEVDSAIQIHEGEVDPHPGYATDADLSTHVAHSDPHPNYATDTDVTAHNSATAVHGVPDTTALATTASLDNHTNDWTGVHGIPDTQALATDAEVATAVGNHEAAANPHPGYATDTDLAGHTHSDLMTDLANHDVDTTNVHGITDTTVLATDAEVASAVGDHAAAADPHTGYQKESEKGAANGYASLDAGTLVPVAQLATGTPDGTKFLRDDRTWVLPTGGGGVSIPQQDDEPVGSVDDDLWIDTDESAGVGLSSIIGYTQVVANQTGMAAGPTDLTGLSVSVTVPAGRRLRITGYLSAIQYTDATTAHQFLIYQDGVQVGRLGITPRIATTDFFPINGSVILSPAAGAHTYKLVATRYTGAGTASNTAGADNPSFILVEDITGTLWPAGQSVDTGMLPIVPACRVYNSAAIAVLDNSLTTLTFNSERYDTDLMHDTSSLTSRITFTRGGIYLIGGGVSYEGATDYLEVSLRIILNGTTTLVTDSVVIQNAATAGTIRRLSVSTAYLFAANDYIELIAYQDNSASASRNVLVEGNRSPEFHATYLGRAV